ncbi:hypothetical protein JX265_006886 [Neoarthrinium moseri]|uniref:Protein kinase domain-containing protein n=1 Tax=Neoarthrinium moseri TaxID=1658444 RepID=A0A9P9WL42_9PEZI|nr:hypothetical protein JX265_006886 [Neoarthrinium moseri]
MSDFGAWYLQQVRWTAFRMGCYRAGIYPDKDASRPLWETLRLPIIDPNPPNQAPPRFFPYRRPPVDDPGRNLDQARAPTDLREGVPRDAWRRLQEAKSLFGLAPGITYTKTLGFGGNGLALLYRTARGRRFVVKVPLGGPAPEADIRREMRHLRTLRRSKHITNMLGSNDIGMPRQRTVHERPPQDDSSDESDSSDDDSVVGEPPPKRRRKQLTHAQIDDRVDKIFKRFTAWMDAENARGSEKPGTNEDDTQPWNYLLLEYMGNGDLGQMIQRCLDMRLEVPNYVLWSFWLCLIRSCIALAYPVHKFHPDRKNSAIKGDLTEVIPAGHRQRWIRRLVHFDIDPQNILIADPDPDNEHIICPTLKLADFGVAEKIKPQKCNWYYERRRVSGKNGNWAPEQFDSTWDAWAPNMWGADICDDPICGNYGVATNIWGVALTMWSLMTRCKPINPPWGADTHLRYDRAFGEDRSKNWNHFSYGTVLRNDGRSPWQYVDRRLRYTIVKCLARRPQDRPSLQELLDEATTNQGFRYSNDGAPSSANADGTARPPETADSVRAWLQNVLHNAQPPPSMGLDDWTIL